MRRPGITGRPRFDRGRYFADVRLRRGAFHIRRVWRLPDEVSNQKERTNMTITAWIIAGVFIVTAFQANAEGTHYFSDHNGGFIVVPHGSPEEAHLEAQEDCLAAMEGWNTAAEVAMHQDNIIKAYDDLVAAIKTDLHTMNKYYSDHQANYICEFPYLAYRPEGYVLPGPANRNQD